jgi:hypothetical protein
MLGYQQADTRFIASRLFPVVQVDKDGGIYYIFTKKYWFTDNLRSRAYGAKFARSGYGLSTATFKTLQWGLEHPIADEIRKNSTVPMDLEQAGLRWLAGNSNLRKEIQFSADFMVTGVWGTDDNNSATDWDDTTNGDPVNDILTAARTISNNAGVTANTLAVGNIVHQALVNHPDIIDRVKYTKQVDIATMEQALMSLLGVEKYLVGKATYNAVNEAGTFVATPIIDDDALVCYTNNAPGIFEPSAGYTFAWQGGGGQGQVKTYRDETVNSDVLQHQEQWDQKVVATDVGYFFADIV